METARPRFVPMHTEQQCSGIWKKGSEKTQDNKIHLLQAAAAAFVVVKQSQSYQSYTADFPKISFN